MTGSYDGSGTMLGVRVTPLRRVAFFVGCDVVLLVAAVMAANVLRFDGATPSGSAPVYLLSGLALGLIFVVLGLVFEVYRVAWSFVGLRDVGRVATVVGLASVSAIVLLLAARGLGGPTPSLAVMIIQAPISFCLLAGFRLSKRAARLAMRGVSLPPAARHALIIGAGVEGAQVLKSILDAPEHDLHVVGILDDDPLARGTAIHGVRVLGPISSLEQQLASRPVEVVIICLPTADRTFVQRIVAITRRVGVPKVRIVPSVSELVDGKLSLETTRAVTLEDLLGREPVQIDLQGVRQALRGRTVLVTGAAGTIGSELCRQVARFDVRKLVVLDVDETRLHDLALELAHLAPQVEVVQALVDVRDRASLDQLFAQHDIAAVYHAAAYKHVPMMERWPVSALHVNVMGTANVARAAHEHGAERFVLISTDKAVEPSSIMGASKRLAELVLFGTPRRGLRVQAVRFGNVLGSRGSVLPTFEAQLKRGGPLTVTHPEVERYFMITSEAVQLVLQASVMGSDREVFVLDMGRPVKILDVAREFIRLNGYEPEKDIKIQITGLRPGEKLTEILHYEHEPLKPTAHPRIFQTSVHVAPQDAAILDAIQGIVETRDQDAARRYFWAAFPSLAPPDEARREPWQRA